MTPDDRYRYSYWSLPYFAIMALIAAPLALILWGAVLLYERLS